MLREYNLANMVLVITAWLSTVWLIRKHVESTSYTSVGKTTTTTGMMVVRMKTYNRFLADHWC